MAKPLRYTGDWPPPDVLQKYPNWTYALDEEGEPGQDETTVKPEDEQSFITPDTHCTAANLWPTDGRTMPAIICLMRGLPVGVSAFDRRWSWSVWKNRHTKLWEPAVQDYLPENERLPSVVLSDNSFFPLRFASVLPREIGGQPWRFEIRPDGSLAEWVK